LSCRQALQLQSRKHLLLGGGKNSRALAMLEEISEKQIGLERVRSGEIGIAGAGLFLNFGFVHFSKGPAKDNLPNGSGDRNRHKAGSSLNAGRQRHSEKCPEHLPGRLQVRKEEDRRLVQTVVASDKSRLVPRPVEGWRSDIKTSIKRELRL